MQKELGHKSGKLFFLDKFSVIVFFMLGRIPSGNKDSKSSKISLPQY